MARTRLLKMMAVSSIEFAIRSDVMGRDARRYTQKSVTLQPSSQIQ